MAIIGTVERPRTMTRDEQGYRTYTRTFTVRSNIPNESMYAVELAPGVPHYAPYVISGGEFDLWAKAKTITATQDDDLTLWTVTVNYDSKPIQAGNAAVVAPAGGSPGGPPSSNTPEQNMALPPWQRPWTATTSGVKVETYLPEDRSTPAKRLANSAGQLFDPAPALSKTVLRKTYTGYTLTDGEPKILAYMNRVNDGPWSGYARGQALCTDYTSERVQEQDTWCFRRTIVLDVNSADWGNWNTQIVDMGTYAKPAAGQKPKPFEGKNGEPMSDPVPLDGNGARLADGLPLVYLTFQLYKEANFDTIV